MLLRFSCSCKSFWQFWLDFTPYKQDHVQSEGGRNNIIYTVRKMLLQTVHLAAHGVNALAINPCRHCILWFANIVGLWYQRSQQFRWQYWERERGTFDITSVLEQIYPFSYPTIDVRSLRLCSHEKLSLLERNNGALELERLFPVKTTWYSPRKGAIPSGIITWSVKG